MRRQSAVMHRVLIIMATILKITTRAIRRVSYGNDTCFPERGLPIPWIPLVARRWSGRFLRSSAKNLHSSPLPSLAKLIERLKEKLRQTGEGGGGGHRRRATFVTGSRRVLRMLLYVTGNKSSPAAYTDQRRRPKEFSKLSKARRKETLLNIVYIYIHEACIGTHLILTRIREVEPIIQLVSLGNLPRVRVSRKLWKKGRGLMFRWKN